MLEQEIKLHVPAGSRKAVAEQLAALPGPRRQRLRAMYFDTADRALGRQLASLRLRQEGRRWVQTFKMAGGDALSRIELNHPRPGPTLDLSVYGDTPARAVLDKARNELVLFYETDIMRMTREVRTRQGVVELAYDVGSIRAGELEVFVNELELERKSGEVRALFTQGARWLRQHELILDPRSKAERGDALARANAKVQAASSSRRAAVRAEQLERYWAPSTARSVWLDEAATPLQALASIATACFDQIARNATLLAEVDTAHLEQGYAGADHVHQLRVGMRRLRSAWRLFKGWSVEPGAELQEGARYHFGKLGAARDADVLGDTVRPALERAGMPSVTLPADGATDVAALVQGPDFQLWLLDLLGWSVELSADESGAAQKALRRPLIRRLRKWHKRILSDGRHFQRLDEDAKHALRKRAKRLRYGLSFARSLLPAQSLKSYQKRLAALQDVLGEINDLVTARERYAGMTDSVAPAWFALGWISCRLDDLYADAQEAIDALSAVRPFWR